MENICRWGGNNYNRSSSENFRTKIHIKSSPNFFNEYDDIRERSLWASTLRNTLRGREKDIDADINFWQLSIQGNKTDIQALYRDRSPDFINKKILEAKNIKRWYIEENKSTYEAPDYKVQDKWLVLFQKFREDKYYHLKNIVELATKGLLTELMGFADIDATLVRTSDADDVFWGTDIILTYNTPTGKEYMGIDVAVSEDKKYLDKKEARTETLCREFNKVHQLGERRIDRVVFAFPPEVMATFLSEYMKRIATEWQIGKGQGYLILRNILRAQPKHQQAILSAIDKIQKRINTIIH